MRARVLPATASDVPRSPSRDDSDATTQPCARVRRISVPSNIFYIEPAGSRVRRNHADSSLTPTDARTGRTHEITHAWPTRPSTWLSCALARDQIRTGIPFEVCDLSYSLLAARLSLSAPPSVDKLTAKWRNRLPRLTLFGYVVASTNADPCSSEQPLLALSPTITVAELHMLCGTGYWRPHRPVHLSRPLE